MRNIGAIFMTENFSFIFKLVAIWDSQTTHAIAGFVLHSVEFFPPVFFKLPKRILNLLCCALKHVADPRGPSRPVDEWSELFNRPQAAMIFIGHQTRQARRIHD